MTLTPYVASGSLLLDVYILVLPIAGVSKLKLTMKRKLGAIAIFLTGGMWVPWTHVSAKLLTLLRACIASALSVYYRWSLVHNQADFTYTIMSVALLW